MALKFAEPPEIADAAVVQFSQAVLARFARLGSPRTRDGRVPGTEVATPLDVIGTAIDSAQAARIQSNRAAAAMCSALREVIAVAQRNPHAYLTAAGLEQKDTAELAARAAATDAALQLKITPNQVRNQAHIAEVLETRLPELGATFNLGLIGYAQASVAVEAAVGITDPDDLAAFDHDLATVAADLAEGAFRARARVMADKLRKQSAEVLHARAMTERGVWVENDRDGMAFLHAYVSAVDAARFEARMNKTAKSIAKAKGGDPRSRQQIRADLLVAWLAGDGTPTAAKVRPLLFVPMLSLIGLSEQPAVLQGYGPIDRVSAAQLFADAPAFRRVGTDPFTGEVLSFDRDRYRPTKAQREWLAMLHGTCSRDQCTRLAVESDIDHLDEWARDTGPTNEDNLIPLCPADHRLKTLTAIHYKRGADRSITVTTPTGYSKRTPPRHPLGDVAPF